MPCRYSNPGHFSEGMDGVTGIGSPAWLSEPLRGDESSHEVKQLAVCKRLCEEVPVPQDQPTISVADVCAPSKHHAEI